MIGTSYKKIILMLSILCLCGNVYGQCQEGIGNTPGCIPMEVLTGENTGQAGYSSRPSVRWVTQWGAIAIDNRIGGAGVVGIENMSNKRRAERAALSICREKGGQACEIILSYRDQCGAFAAGDGFATAYGARTLLRAETLSIEECSKEAQNCKVEYSACSFPVSR